MDSSFSAKFKKCIKDVVPFFTAAPAPAPPPPPPATSVGTDLESADANTNGLAINTDSTGSFQTRSTSPNPSTTNSQLSTEAIHDKVKLFLTICLGPMAYLWSQDKDGELKWYRKMASCMLCVAFASFYTGYSLAKMHLNTANRLTQLGAGCSYLTIFMLVGSRLPVELIIFPIICFAACLAVDIYGST